MNPTFRQLATSFAVIVTTVLLVRALLANFRGQAFEASFNGGDFIQAVIVAAFVSGALTWLGKARS